MPSATGGGGVVSLITSRNWGTSEAPTTIAATAAPTKIRAVRLSRQVTVGGRTSRQIRGSSPSKDAELLTSAAAAAASASPASRMPTMRSSSRTKQKMYQLSLSSLSPGVISIGWLRRSPEKNSTIWKIAARIRGSVRPPPH